MKLSTITYLGHSAALLDYGEKRIAIDPWLTENPRCPEEWKSLPQLDLIILTHAHSDHASEAPQLAQKHSASVAATFELGNILVSEGVSQEQILYMNKGGTITWEGLQISLTDAKHSSSFDTKDGPVYAGEPCGVVVQDGTHSIYHAGDTCLFQDMALIKEWYAPTVALLPIGDVFTMNPQEAARAAKYLGVKTAIPIHHSTFPMLTGTPEEFSTACEQYNINAIPLEPGASLELTKR